MIECGGMWCARLTPLIHLTHLIPLDSTWIHLNPCPFLNLSVFFPTSVMLCQLGQMGQVGQNLFVNSFLVLFCIVWSMSFPYFHINTTDSLPVLFCIVWSMSFPPILTNPMLFFMYLLIIEFSYFMTGSDVSSGSNGSSGSSGASGR